MPSQSKGPDLEQMMEGLWLENREVKRQPVQDVSRLVGFEKF